MQHRLLLNSKREPYDFDENKRFLFLDIDGVLNPLNFERVWVGKNNGGVYDPLFDSHKNWALEEIPIDPSLAYVPTKRYEFMTDAWAEFDPEMQESLSKNEKLAGKRFRKIRAHVSEELISSLNELVKKHELEVVYLTYWRSEALRLLEPELQTGAKSFLDWNTGSDLGVMMKVHALADFIAEGNIKRPYAFLDDEANRPFARQGSRLFRHTDSEAEAVPRLLMNVEPASGLTRANMKTLDEFFTLHP